MASFRVPSGTQPPLQFSQVETNIGAFHFKEECFSVVFVLSGSKSAVSLAPRRELLDGPDPTNPTGTPFAVAALVPPRRAGLLCARCQWRTPRTCPRQP